MLAYSKRRLLIRGIISSRCSRHIPRGRNPPRDAPWPPAQKVDVRRRWRICLRISAGLLVIHANRVNVQAPAEHLTMRRLCRAQSIKDHVEQPGEPVLWRPPRHDDSLRRRTKHGADDPVECTHALSASPRVAQHPIGCRLVDARVVCAAVLVEPPSWRLGQIRAKQRSSARTRFPAADACALLIGQCLDCTRRNVDRQGAGVFAMDRVAQQVKYKGRVATANIEDRCVARKHLGEQRTELRGRD